MSTTGNKSLRFAAFGPPSVLRIEKLPIPVPGDGEALVHVKAAAINPSDIGNVAGHFKKTTLPRTPGRDFAGIVVKGKHHESEEVWGSCPTLGAVHDGSHAEYVVVPVETLSLKPKSLSMAQARGDRDPVHYGLGADRWLSQVRDTRKSASTSSTSITIFPGCSE